MNFRLKGSRKALMQIAATDSASFWDGGSTRSRATLVQTLIDELADPKTGKVDSELIDCGFAKGSALNCRIKTKYDSESVAVLLRAGASPTVKPAEGRYGSLGLAARAGDAKTVRLLLDAGANVFERGYAGRQPVHVAAHNNNGAVLTMLLDAGSSLQQMSYMGETVESLCKKYSASSALARWKETQANAAAAAAASGVPPPAPSTTLADPTVGPSGLPKVVEAVILERMLLADEAFLDDADDMAEVDIE